MNLERWMVNESLLDVWRWRFNPIQLQRANEELTNQWITLALHNAEASPSLAKTIETPVGMLTHKGEPIDGPGVLGNLGTGAVPVERVADALVGDDRLEGRLQYQPSIKWERSSVGQDSGEVGWREKPPSRASPSSGTSNDISISFPFTKKLKSPFWIKSLTNHVSPC